MQKTTILVFLALVAITLAKIPESPQKITEQDRTMLKIFKIMETISLIKWRLIDDKKLANKYVGMLKAISRINWRLIGSLFEQKIISLNGETTIDGYPINLAIMLKTLDIICKIDWTQPNLSPAAPRKSTVSTGAAQVFVEGQIINLDNIAEQLQRISQINWEKFGKQSEKKMNK